MIVLFLLKFCNIILKPMPNLSRILKEQGVMEPNSSVWLKKKKRVVLNTVKKCEFCKIRVITLSIGAMSV